MTPRLPVGVFFALFTVSGFAGLIYQSIWSHYLKLFLGHAAYAQTLVLAIFMGGMALGSWLVSRYTHRIRNLLMGYAIAELGIGLLAVVFHKVFLAATGWAFDLVLPTLGASGVDAFKWALASLLILPASVLLGTTFPLMTAGILRLYPQAGGRALSMLYFTNSFGAAIGVLASGFVLINRFGLPGTVLTAGMVNVALALVVWAIARNLDVQPAPVPAGPAAGAPGPARSTLAGTILLLAFATGAASFIYEITWIRMLTLGLGASTHAFEVMLAAFILAMSLGAFWFRNRINHLRDDLGWLAGLLFAKALLAVYAVWIYGDALGLVQWMMKAVARTDEGYVLSTIAGLAVSMLVMFPAAFCAGMTLPLATHVLTSRGLGESAIGRVYGANTAGCILGAAFATHFGMESFGVKGVTGMGALLDVAAGALVLALTMPTAQRQRAAVPAAVALAVGLAGFITADLDLHRMASGIYRHGQFLDADTRIPFHRDGKTATISVVVESGGTMSIRTNGKPDASLQRNPALQPSVDEETVLLAAALPLAMKPDAKIVANIGFGSGLTTHTLLASPRVVQVDSIEIERMMIEGARHLMPANRRAYEDPRSNIHIEDAKTFFASAGRRYDIIISEPSNPWVSGVSTLFSEEFYAHVRRYLADDGLLVQWVQGYEIDAELLSTVFKALGRQFNDYVVYNVGQVDLLVIAVAKGEVPALTEGALRMPALADDLRRLGLVQLRDLETLRIGGRKALEPYFMQSPYPANSDFFPILDQLAPRAMFRRSNALPLLRLREDLLPIMEMADGDWRVPVSRLSVPGKVRPRRIALAEEGAEAMLLAINGKVEEMRLIRPEQRVAPLVVHGMLSDCRAAQADWMTAVTEVARVSVPFLGRDDVAAFLKRLRESPCGRSLAEPHARRLALLEAINDRDRDALRRHSEYLVQHAPVAGERAYYLGAAVLANVSSGRADVAMALAREHLRHLPPGEREQIALKVALTQASWAMRAARR
ncbi:MAG: spermidine synthase [Pseudomonadota bacterium]|nr:spermidine synthase [Pseudomonadota bacterium]